ncbi:MFS transporter [Alicyclobacillus sp. SO9]|uniref:MDR family MFS transporter n=1 Tax=Alicyclobacillus sp. SO9 TaxID=2665646 RepID=UPI0018E876C8|nr:MFS transporter [Alicyclobacillus sp. SO9]QQE79947.1 MFS transporter [Alicyclobacillus sp. SO9]
MVGQIRTLYRSYHPAVWWMISATAVTKITQFMVFPFVALYMSSHTNASPGVIGLAVGTGALTSTVFGFIGGSFADRFGRKQMMALAMALSAGLMALFPNIHAVYMFFVLSGLNGIVRTLFQPAAQALLSDLTVPEKRGKVFAMDYWAINVGASFGPILGGYFGTVATGWTFYLTAGVDLVYALVILMMFPDPRKDKSLLAKHEKQDHEQKSGPAAGFSFRTAFLTVIRDRAFLVFLIAFMLGGIGYAQIETTLPQVMGEAVNANKAAEMFSIVLASNAIEVVFLQVLLSKIASRLGIVRALMIGQFLFTLGYIGISLSHSLWQYIGSMFVLTLGEIINFPVMNEYISVLADERYRGTYFGASALGALSFFIGPWLGGVILEHAGGMVLFLTAAAVSLLAVPLYRVADRMRLKREPSGNASQGDVTVGV